MTTITDKAVQSGLAAALLTAGLVSMISAEASSPGHPAPFVDRLGCGGNYSGSQATSWTFHNYNESSVITVERMRFYSAHGALLYDSALNALPQASNNVLGPSDNTLEPHQSANFNTDILLADGILAPIPANERPIMLLLDTRRPARASSLAGTVTRITRDTGSGMETGRTAFECRVMNLKPASKG